jgi:hypothetical protein
MPVLSITKSGQEPEVDAILHQVIAEVIGVPKVWPQRGWDYLKRLEQSLQVPRPRHRKGDPESQEAF